MYQSFPWRIPIGLSWTIIFSLVSDHASLYLSAHPGILFRHRHRQNTVAFLPHCHCVVWGTRKLVCAVWRSLHQAEHILTNTAAARNATILQEGGWDLVVSVWPRHESQSPLNFPLLPVSSFHFSRVESLSFPSLLSKLPFSLAYHPVWIKFDSFFLPPLRSETLSQPSLYACKKRGFWRYHEKKFFTSFLRFSISCPVSL